MRGAWIVDQRSSFSGSSLSTAGVLKADESLTFFGPLPTAHHGPPSTRVNRRHSAPVRVRAHIIRATLPLTPAPVSVRTKSLFPRCWRNGGGISRGRYELNRDVALRITPIRSRRSRRLARFSGKRNRGRAESPATSCTFMVLKRVGDVRALVHGTGRRADARGVRLRAARSSDRRGAADRTTDCRGAGGGARARIIHRDLKPANIKVLRRRHGEGPRLRPREDFSEPSLATASDANAALTPTVTSPPMLTSAGSCSERRRTCRRNKQEARRGLPRRHLGVRRCAG